MSRYRELLRSRGVARIIAAQLLARVPGGMLGLALLFHLQRTTGEYATAGAAIGALCVGQAVAGPVTSRLMNRLGMRSVVLVCSLLSAAAVTAIALAHAPRGAAIALAFAAGITTPPVQSAVRTIYPRMAPFRLHGALFSLDAALQELIWIGGPVAVTFVATGVGTTAGLLLPAVAQIVGGAWFGLSPEVGRTRIPAPTGRFGSVLGKPPILVATAVGMLVVAFCACTEAAIVGAFGTSDPMSGVVLAVWSVASLTGGVALGSLQLGRWSLAVRLALVAAGAVLLPFVSGFAGFSIALAVSGFWLAPALGVLSAVVSRSVRFGDSAEAFGWLTTGQLVGAAAGSAIAGFALDAFGSSGALTIAAALAAAAALSAAAGSSWNPDLRDGAGTAPTGSLSILPAV